MRPNDLRRHVANLGLDLAEDNLRGRHCSVERNGHNDHADLLIDGLLRVEVKASLFTTHKHSRGRYQFNTRNRPDVYVLVCIGSGGHAFIIPDRAIEDRTNVAIWSQDPLTYTGMWRRYLNQWDIVQQELNRCQRRQGFSSPARTRT